MQLLNDLSGGIFMVKWKKYQVLGAYKNKSGENPDCIVWYLKEIINQES
jgi:hypothetical protein